VTQAARLLQVSKMTVYRLIHTGKLAATKKGGSFRVPRTGVSALRNDPRGHAQEWLEHTRQLALDDETRFLNNATTAAGDQRRYPGTTPQDESGQPSVFLVSTVSPLVIDREGYPPTSESDDPQRRRDPGIGERVELATERELMRQTVTRILDAGAQIGPLSADEIYRDHPDLRSGDEHIGLNYVMAISGDHRIQANSGRGRAADLARAAGRKGWQRLPTRTASAGDPSYDWLLIEPNPHPNSTARGQLLLVGRLVSNPTELTYYICHSAQPAPLAELVAVAGSRCHSPVPQQRGLTTGMGPGRSSAHNDLSSWWCRAGERWWWVLAVAVLSP
jgi:excisionase family DNA binding protein